MIEYNIGDLFTETSFNTDLNFGSNFSAIISRKDQQI